MSMFSTLFQIMLRSFKLEWVQYLLTNTSATTLNWHLCFVCDACFQDCKGRSNMHPDPHPLQEPHFLMLFAAAKDVGYFDPAMQRCDHVGFGLVFGPDGKKLKTREGETIRCRPLKRVRNRTFLTRWDQRVKEVGFTAGFQKIATLRICTTQKSKP